jgi:glycosyltransferase involved in cell wall biosynthesis
MEEENDAQRLAVICREIHKAKLTHINEVQNKNLRPVLSIAIPTYNRESRLKRQIIEILSQIERCGIGKQVEIVISDNASNDGTADVFNNCSKLNLNLPKTSFFRNNSNLGVDGNFALAILRATGTYVWLLSDDDILFEYSVEFIYNKILQLNDPSNACFFINYHNTIEENSSTAVPEIGPEDGLLLDEFMFATELKFSIISSCVFSRDKLNEVEFDQYIGTNYVHMFVMLQCLQDRSGSIVRRSLFRNDHPGVLVSRSNSKFRDKGKGDFYLNAHMSYLYFISTLLKSSINWMIKLKYIKMAGDENANQIIYYKITNNGYDSSYILKVTLKMISIIWYNPFLYFFHLPLLISPNIVAKVIEPFRWKYLKLRGQFVAKLKRIL